MTKVIYADMTLSISSYWVLMTLFSCICWGLIFMMVVLKERDLPCINDTQKTSLISTLITLDPLIEPESTLILVVGLSRTF